MNNKNYVLFKGNKDGIIILLDETVEFSIIKQQLNEKMKDAKNFFQGAKTSINFKGRNLSEQEQKELIDIIDEQTNLNISYIKDDNTQDNNIKTENLVQDVKKDVLKDNNQKNIDIRFQNSITKFHKGTVRSGGSVSYDGNIVILGDVNPGAEVIAGGNIIVLGSLKGIVHAGCKGNDAFIIALHMNPIQLRIADIITRAPDNKQNKKEISPSIAYVHDKKVYIEPIDHKLLENF